MSQFPANISNNPEYNVHAFKTYHNPNPHHINPKYNTTFQPNNPNQPCQPGQPNQQYQSIQPSSDIQNQATFPQYDED